MFNFLAKVFNLWFFNSENTIRDKANVSNTGFLKESPSLLASLLIKPESNSALWATKTPSSRNSIKAGKT